MYKVYKHTNKINGKIYIGITSNTLKQRWNGGYNNNKHFSDAIKKYGKDGFESEIIADNLTKAQAEQMERDYIKKYDTTDHTKGYNIELGGNSNGKHAEETKRKISQAQKGRPLTEEHKKHLRKPHNFTLTDKNRKILSDRMRGNKYTLGFKHSEETKRKMSEAHKGLLCKKVFCSDGNIFESVTAAADHYGLTRHTVMNMCNGKTKRSNNSKLKFSYEEV